MALKFKLSPDGRIRKESEQGQRGKAVRHKGQDKGGRETGWTWPLRGQFISI